MLSLPSGPLGGDDLPMWQVRRVEGEDVAGVAGAMSTGGKVVLLGVLGLWAWAMLGSVRKYRAGGYDA